jgi:hypothetical protein
MSRGIAALGLVGALVMAALVSSPLVSLAESTKADVAALQETEEERKEREGRTACTIAVCAVLHNRKPGKGQIACSLRKTWRKEAIDKALARSKLPWPWGATRCGSDIKVDRALLLRAMQEPELEIELETHRIHCQIENAGDKYEISVQVRPKVTFKQGRATKASMNWGKIEAPTLAWTALRSMAATDNTFGLLQSVAIEDINKFIDTKCMEVKDEWQGK